MAKRMYMKALFLLTVLLTCLGLQSVSGSGPNLDAPQLSFVSDRDGKSAIYAMNLDGSVQTPLLDFGSRIRNQAWSPDGKQLAFSADYHGNTDIFIINVDCEGAIEPDCVSTPTNLTETVSDDIEPAWSSDGDKIAFRSGRGDDFLWNIFFIELQESRLTQVITDFNDFAPTWSPDGTRLAVQSLREGNWEIYVMDLDGSNPVRLTNHIAFDYRPRWSPDGSKIAFDSFRDGNWEIYVRDVDCNSSESDCIQNLTHHEANDGGAAWSPDGSQLAFTSDREGNFEIYTMDSDGTNVVRLTRNESNDTEPSWRTLSG